jgi:hypothetical protein
MSTAYVARNMLEILRKTYEEEEGDGNERDGADGQRSF